MTFKIYQFSNDFPEKFIFPGFSMIFHDRGNPEYNLKNLSFKNFKKKAVVHTAL